MRIPYTPFCWRTIRLCSVDDHDECYWYEIWGWYGFKAYFLNDLSTVSSASIFCNLMYMMWLLHKSLPRISHVRFSWCSLLIASALQILLVERTCVWHLSAYKERNHSQSFPEIIFFVQLYQIQKKINWQAWSNNLICLAKGVLHRHVNVRCLYCPRDVTVLNWGVFCQKKVTRARTSYYIPQYPWDVINCPCPCYPIMSKHFWIDLATLGLAKFWTRC